MKARLSRNTAEEKDGRYESMCVKAEIPAAQQRGNSTFQDPKSTTGQFVEEAKLLVEDFIRLGKEEKFECVTILFGKRQLQ